MTSRWWEAGYAGDGKTVTEYRGVAGSGMESYSIRRIAIGYPESEWEVLSGRKGIGIYGKLPNAKRAAVRHRNQIRSPL